MGLRSLQGGAWVLTCVLVLGGLEFLPAQAVDPAAKKSALVRSLILPGWGQHYLGAPLAARRLAVTEAGLWLGFILLRESSQGRRQDYRAYAAVHAGVDAISKSRPDIYYFNLGDYDSITAYNQERQRRRELDDVYTLGVGNDWQWDDPANRTRRYRDLRQTSLSLAKAATFTLGGMIVNRSLAALHILFLSRSSTPATAQLMPLPSGGVVSLRWEF